jgi:hypothetical protein
VRNRRIQITRRKCRVFRWLFGVWFRIRFDGRQVVVAAAAILILFCGGIIAEALGELRRVEVAFGCVDRIEMVIKVIIGINIGVKSKTRLAAGFVMPCPA